MKNVTLFLILLLVLVGCGGGQAVVSQPDASGDAATPSPEPSLTPTLTVQESTPTMAAGGTSPSVPDEMNERFAITSMSYGNLAQLMEFPVPDVVRAIDFTPDSRLMAASYGNSSESEVYIWDLDLQELILVLSGHEGIIWDIAFSPDGKELASSSADGTVRIWRTADGEQLQVLQHPSDISSVAFSPDGSILAAGGVREWPVAAVWLYDTDSWALVDELEAAWNIPGIVFYPERGYIVGGGISRNVSVWSDTSGEELFLLYHPGQLSALDRDRDGEVLITAPCVESEDSVCVRSELWAWDMGTGRIAYQAEAYSSDINDMDVSPLGDLLVTVGRSRFIRFHRVEDLYMFAYFDSFKGSLHAAAFSPDATYLAVGGNEVVQVWAITSGE